MRPSKLNPEKLKTLFAELGIIFHKTNQKVMERQIEETGIDYPFELVIKRRGCFIMDNQSLTEWQQKDHRMKAKLEAKNINILPFDGRNVILKHHANL